MAAELATDRPVEAIMDTIRDFEEAVYANNYEEAAEIAGSIAETNPECPVCRATARSLQGGVLFVSAWPVENEREVLKGMFMQRTADLREHLESAEGSEGDDGDI